MKSLSNLEWLFQLACDRYNLRKNLVGILDILQTTEILDIDVIINRYLVVKRINKMFTDLFLETMQHHGNYNRIIQDMKVKLQKGNHST